MHIKPGAWEWATFIVAAVIWLVGLTLLVVTAASAIRDTTAPSKDLLATVAQVNAGLLIAFAIEGPVKEFGHEVARAGALLSAVSLALALAAFEIDPAWWNVLVGPLALAGTYGAIVFLLTRLMGLRTHRLGALSRECDDRGRTLKQSD